MNGFQGLIKERSRLCNELEWRSVEWQRVSMVALILDGVALNQVRDSKADNEYAVIKVDPESGEVVVLYSVSCPSKEIAFYMMCVDACDGPPDGKVDRIAQLDPEYRQIDVLEIMRDVGERACWQVDKIWDCFVEFCHSGEIEPYRITDATKDHFETDDFM
jgi:hypothetical protein